MQQVDPGVGQVMERLHNLESLVEELKGQLVHANSAAAGSASSGASGGNSLVTSPADSNHNADHRMGALPTTTSSTGMQNQFGRLVLQDAGHSRYVSSGFWSRINDEVSSDRFSQGILTG
jgi:hypothetical protein